MQEVLLATELWPVFQRRQVHNLSARDAEKKYRLSGLEVNGLSNGPASSFGSCRTQISEGRDLTELGFHGALNAICSSQ
jgi:hypothetical protein